MVAIFFLVLIAYFLFGMCGSAVLGRHKVSDALFWAPNLAMIPVKKVRQIQAERKRIPTATEVVSGVIAVAVVKHFDEWKLTRKFSHSLYQHHELRHKQIKVERHQDYTFQPATWKVYFGGDSIPLSNSLTKALEESWGLFNRSVVEKAHYQKEQKLLNTLEEYLK